MFQDFSISNFIKLETPSDYYKYFTKLDCYENSRQLFNHILNQKKYKIFQTLSEYNLNNKVCYKLRPASNNEEDLLQFIYEKYILKKVSDNISKVFNVKQADRYRIIGTLSNILEGKQEGSLIRLDIKNFYESINRKKLLNRIYNSSLLSIETKNIIKKIFSNPLLKNTNGLPRGLSVSANLAEFYMKNFDKFVQQNGDVFFYARYVDDIIICSTLNPVQIKRNNFIEYIKNNLPDGLKFHNNSDKYGIYNLVNNISFTFLGYKINVINTSKIYDNKVRISNIENNANKEKYRDVFIDISKNKVNKIKEKIVKSFLYFKHRRDFNLLKKRLQFLTVSFPITKTPLNNSLTGKMFLGISYNYSLLNITDSLVELDKFLKMMINNSNIHRFSDLLSEEQKVELNKLSFLYSFNHRFIRSYAINKFNSITRCWRKKYGE